MYVTPSPGGPHQYKDENNLGLKYVLASFSGQRGWPFLRPSSSQGCVSLSKSSKDVGKALASGGPLAKLFPIMETRRHPEAPGLARD